MLEISEHEKNCTFHRGLHWIKYQYLESKMLEISKYITLDKENLETFSEELGDLLVLIGNEVDTFFRDGLECPNLIKEAEELGVSEKKKKNIQDYKRIYEPKYELSENTIKTQYRFGEDFKMHPFLDFKKDIPCWWHSYNNIKHHYYTSLKEANLRNVINSLAGLLILNALHICSKKYLLENKYIKSPYIRAMVMGHEIIERRPYHDSILKSNIGTSIHEPALFITTELFDFSFRIAQ